MKQDNREVTVLIELDSATTDFKGRNDYLVAMVRNQPSAESATNASYQSVTLAYWSKSTENVVGEAIGSMALYRPRLARNELPPGVH